MIDSRTLWLFMLPEVEVGDLVFFFLLNNFPVSPSSAAAVCLPPSLLHHHAQPEPVLHRLQGQRGDGENSGETFIFDNAEDYVCVWETFGQPRRLLSFSCSYS